MSSDPSEVREEGKPCIWKYICLMYGRRFQARIALDAVAAVGRKCGDASLRGKALDCLPSASQENTFTDSRNSHHSSDTYSALTVHQALC